MMDSKTALIIAEEWGRQEDAYREDQLLGAIARDQRMVWERVSIRLDTEEMRQRSAPTPPTEAGT